VEERSARVSRLAVARAKRASFSASRQSRVPVPYPQRRRRCRSRRQKSAGLLSKPSDGLEPLTPSLPCDPVGSRWQSVATIPLVPAVLESLRAPSPCRPLPPRFSRTFPSVLLEGRSRGPRVGHGILSSWTFGRGAIQKSPVTWSRANDYALLCTFSLGSTVRVDVGPRVAVLRSRAAASVY